MTGFRTLSSDGIIVHMNARWNFVQICCQTTNSLFRQNCSKLIVSNSKRGVKTTPQLLWHIFKDTSLGYQTRKQFSLRSRGFYAGYLVVPYMKYFASLDRREGWNILYIPLTMLIRILYFCCIVTSQWSNMIHLTILFIQRHWYRSNTIPPAPVKEPQGTIVKISWF